MPLPVNAPACPRCGTAAFAAPGGPRMCAHCGGEVPPGIRFCGRCGRPQAAPAAAVACPRCGSPGAPGRQHCGACGLALGPGHRPPGKRPWATRVAVWVGLGILGGLAAFVALVAVAAIFFVEDEQPSRAAAGASRPVAATLPLVGEKNPVEVREMTVGPAGGSLRLKDGAEVTVPKGALAEPLPLRVERFEPGFETADFTVGSSAAYRVTLGGEGHRTLDPPATLRIPWAPDRTLVVTDENGKWVSTRTTGGEAVTVYIDRFSVRVFLAVGASLASGLRTVGEQLAGALPRWDLRPSLRDKEAAHRERIRGRSAATQQFYGVGEVTAKAHAAICEEFRTVMQANREKFTFQPKDPGPGIVQLTKHLGDAGKPSAGDSSAQWFWDATKGSHDTIRQRVIAAGLGHPISPAAVLRIAVDANGGNVPLGVLAAHNLLKNVAYEGRQLADPNETFTGGVQDVTPADGQLAASIETWRRGSDHSPSGRYDKMGPLYHIFAAMAARVWGGAAYGQSVVSVEAVLRGVGWGSDIPDPDKGAADECGLDIGAWLETLQDAVVLTFEPVTAKIETGKALPLTLTVKNLPADGVSVTLAVTSGEGTLSRTGISAAKGKSSSTCDVNGSTAICGFTLTPAKTGSITVEARWGKVAATVVVGGEVCVEGTPSPLPLTGGLKRVESSSFSFCFPESGGDARGRLIFDVYTEDGISVGGGPVDVSCSYRLRLTYELTGSFAPPNLSGKATATSAIDVSTLSGKDCSSNRRSPNQGPAEIGAWTGTFADKRFRAILPVTTDRREVTMAGSPK